MARDLGVKVGRDLGVEVGPAPSHLKDYSVDVTHTGDVVPEKPKVPSLADNVYTYVDPATHKEALVWKNPRDPALTKELHPEVMDNPPQGMERKYPGGVPGGTRGFFDGRLFGFLPTAAGGVQGTHNYVEKLLGGLKNDKSFDREVLDAEKEYRDLYEGTNRETDIFAPAQFAGTVTSGKPGSSGAKIGIEAVKTAAPQAVASRAGRAILPVVEGATTNGLVNGTPLQALIGNTVAAGTQGATYALGHDPRGITSSSLADAAKTGAVSSAIGAATLPVLTGGGLLLQTPQAQRVPVVQGLTTETMPPVAPTGIDAIKSPFRWLATRWNEESMANRGGEARVSAARPSASGLGAAIEARGATVGEAPGPYGATLNSFKIPEALRTDQPGFADTLRQRYPWLKGILGTGERPLLGPHADAPAMESAGKALTERSGERLGELRSQVPKMEVQPVVDAVASRAASIRGQNPVVGDAVANEATNIANRVRDTYQPATQIEVPTYGDVHYPGRLVGVSNVESGVPSRPYPLIKEPITRLEVTGSKPVTVRPTAPAASVDEVSRLRNQFRDAGQYSGFDPTDQAVSRFNAGAEGDVGRAINAHVEGALPPEQAALHAELRKANAMGHAVTDITNGLKSAVAAPHSVSSEMGANAASVAATQAFGAPAAVPARLIGRAVAKQSNINPGRAWNLSRTAEGIEGNGINPWWQLKGAAIRSGREIPGDFGTGGAAWSANEKDAQVQALARFLNKFPESDTAKYFRDLLSGQSR